MGLRLKSVIELHEDIKDTEKKKTISGAVTIKVRDEALKVAPGFIRERADSFFLDPTIKKQQQVD